MLSGREYISGISLFLQFSLPYQVQYCCTIWGQCNKTDIYSIIKLQKQAARLILDADKYSSSSPLFDQLEWETFDKIVQEKQATMVFKALNNLTPDYISNLFKPTCTNTNHSLRSKTSINSMYQQLITKALGLMVQKSGILYPMKHSKQQH